MNAPFTVTFWGTPAPAARCLEYLLDHGVGVVAAVTQPDRPVGRKQLLEKPPVKVVAETAGIPVFQPQSLKQPDIQRTIAAITCDIAVVVAYGKILPAALLNAGAPFINLHFSLLPKYRGAAPVQRALMDGCRQTGATVQHIAEKLDTGDAILQAPVDIAEDDTCESLLTRCVAVGAPLLLDALQRLKNGTAPRVPQDDTQTSFAPKIEKEDGFIVWERPACAIHNQVRACYPWPGATTWLDMAPVRVWKTVVAASDAPTRCAGDILPSRKQLLVQTGTGVIELIEVQPANGKRMSGQAFLAGHHSGAGRFISWTRP